jgi:putative ABC transport system permease protein
MILYRLLLRLYPASFRAEYGVEMQKVFQSELGDASSAGAQAGVWLRAFANEPVNAVRIHLDLLNQDLRYTCRAFGRMPGLFIAVMVVAALGIGATTASFSVANHVFLRPLPFPESDRLVQLWQAQPSEGYVMELSPANYRDWKAESSSFEQMGVYTNRSANLIGVGDPERLDGVLMTWDLFDVLRVPPALGRTFSEADDRPGAPGVVVIADGLWRTLFAADRGVIGRRIILDDEPHEIVGVMPRGFYFPSREIEFWKPIRFRQENFEDRTDTYIKAVARLREDSSLDRARAEMNVIAGRLAAAFPDSNKGIRAFIHLLHDQVSDRSRLMLFALVGGSLCVLLIACTNLANLLLSRALSRQRELAVRMALGAGAERVMRQMLTESLLLAACGGALGILLAWLAAPLVARLVPTTLPIADVAPLDVRVLLFAAVATCLTGVGFGIVPALRVRRDRAFNALREGGRSGAGPETQRLRAILVLAEVAASVVLLVSAALLLRALWQVQQIDPGFATDGVLTLRSELPLPKYGVTARRQRFYDEVLAGVRALPGVSQAAYISSLPMVMRGGIWWIEIAGRPLPRDERAAASLRQVTPGFFATLGIPILHGRDVTGSDTATTPFVAVISHSFAKQHWPDENPLGRQFNVAFFDRTVVGVVGDVRVRGLERTDSEPQVYIPSTQVPDNGISSYSPKDLAIKATVPPTTLVPAVRQIIAKADPHQPVSDIRLLSEIVAGETASRRVQLRALAAFASIAFVLAALGIHALLAYHVSTRIHEIGVRMALGARAVSIVGLIARQVIVLTSAGLAIGLFLSWMVARWLSSLLAGVSPSDALAFGSASVLVLVMAALGSVRPVVRAVRVSPIVALRE